MTFLERLLRRELPRHANTLMDYYPLRGVADEGQVPAWVTVSRIDETVFGPRQPERAEPDYPGDMRTCGKHDVRWRSAGACWCCAAGVAAVGR